MIKLDLPLIPILGPLIQARLVESKLEHRLTMDRGLDKVHHIVEHDMGDAFTDDLELPTVALVMHVGPSAIFEEVFCNVLLIYIAKEGRSVEKALKAGRFIEEYARSKKCDVINGDSWTYRGSDGIGAFWKRLGYEEQAINYVKHLNGK